MKFSAVVAMSENHAIGLSGQLLWHLPNDLKHFKKLTMGKPIIMGRTTYESIGKPLPGRTNIILTKNKHYLAPGCVVLHDKKSVFDYCQFESEIMIVGGAQIYELFLQEITTLYLTKVHTQIVGDTYFPQISLKEWQEISQEKHLKNDTHAYDYTFMTWAKKS